MKIAMIGHKRIPSREGGVEIVVEELATRLADNGHNVVAFNRSGKHTTGDKFEKIHNYKFVEIKTIPTLNIRGVEVFFYSLFATISAIQGKFDVIHYHAEGSAAMCWLPKLFKIKTIVTIHGLDWQRAKWGGFASAYIKHGEKVAVRHADEIIVLSKNVENYFMKQYSRQTTYIPNGITVKPKLDASIIKKYGLSEKSYILFLARIVPEKGLHYLLEAFMDTDTDKKLVIAGAPSQTGEYFEEMKELALEDERIIMTGFVKGEELEELYSNAYLYVLPSDLEGMPISLLEAMSYACPCLVSDIPESVEVVGDVGFKFHRANSEDLKLQLEKLLTSPEDVEQSGLSLKQIVSQNFTWDKMVSETIKLYEK